MPRVDNLGANVDEYCQKNGEGSSTHDVCRRCFNDLKRDPHCHDDKLQPYNGDPQGVDGWGGDVGTPDLYEVMNAECPGSYRCTVCDKVLGRADN